MATSSEPDRLSDAESADLSDRVGRFRAAWRADGSGGMARYLPPPGARHRAAVLVQVAVADMERRATAGLPFRVETYVSRFPKDLSGDAPPVALLVAEYRLRLQFTDKPELDEYKDRFPARFADFARGLEPPGGSAAQSTRPSIVLPVVPARPTVPDIADIADLASLPAPAGSARIPPPPPRPDEVGSTRVADRAPGGTDGPRKSTMVESRPPPKSRGSKIGDLVVTNSGDLDATPVRHLSGGASTILPADAPYELLRKLGEGAFGEVFEALAPGGIRVAVKRISRNSNHPASRAEQDALEVVKNLSHPFLLKTQAYWVFDDRLVIVMELADGSLADRVEKFQAQGRIGIPPEDLIPLFEQAAKALDYLHGQNVSHRDIKPENILILKDHAKVADFGLARPQEHAMTMVGQTVGTPAFMAPEMWQQKVSIHSDQYSLAATYVRCRLGRNLFDTTVLIEMASFHIHETPDLAPLSAAEQAVLLKALAKNPDDRFPSCGEFAAALRAAVLSPAMGTGGSGFGLQGGTAIRAALEPPPAPPKPGALRAMLPMAAVGLACVITIIVALKLMIPPPTQPTGPAADSGKGGTNTSNPQPPPPEAEKRYARVPGWEPLTTERAVKIGDKFYPRVLTRAVAGEALEAVLVFSGKEGDPENPFYILRNKVTNRVFAEAFEDALRSHPTTVTNLTNNVAPFPVGAWKDGVVAGGRVTESKAGLPVLGLSLPEALMGARGLGGRLPTFLEWKTAAGAFHGDPRPSPAGALLVVPREVEQDDDPTKAGAYRRGLLSKRNLALGLERDPWPVARATDDVSEPWKVHQLVSNGREWLGEYGASAQLINPDDDLPPGRKFAKVIGHGPHEALIVPLAKLTPGEQEWNETRATANGFRAVLTPK